ncbi:hypothetical protein GCM10009101_30710 [Brevundimonas lenta]
MLKFLRGDTVTKSDAHLVDLVAKLAGLGLLFLWISGIGFLVMAWFNNPQLLTSPKVQAKLLVVGILTINGAFLHFKVLPQVERAVGRPLFCRSGARSDRIWMRVCGAVSAASWWTPFFLGTVRELNFAAPIHVFLAAYAVLLAVCLIGFTVVEHYLSTRWARSHPGVAPDVAPAVHAAPAALLYAKAADDRPAIGPSPVVAAEEKSFARSHEDQVDLHDDLDRRIRERQMRAARRRLGASDAEAGDDAGDAARH